MIKIGNFFGKTLRFLFGSVLICFAIGIFSNSAMAIEEKPEFRMDIYPAQKDLETVKPGDSYSDKFTLENSGKQDFNYEVSFTPYSVKGENYEPDYDEITQYSDIVNWISVDSDSGKLASGEKIEISYSIDIPSDAHGGAQSGVIMVTMKPNSENESTGVVAERRLGYIVFCNVDGVIVKTGKILENKIPGFLFNPPIYASTIVENIGNVYTRAKYSLQVFPLFSDEEVYTNEENPNNSVIFPETKRMNQIQWEGAPQLGIFRVKSTVKIFDEESVTEKLVFLCPIWFLFIVILLIFCIIFWIVSRIFRRRKEV